MRDSSTRVRTARKNATRGRGRPAQRAGAPDVRRILLDEARKLFARRGFQEVGTREIAAAAGVNPAMIHYYFGDKEGLYRAMLEATLDRVLGQLRELAGSSEQREDPISALLELYVGAVARDPWFPRLMIREVLSEGAPFREEFIERFASRAAELVPSLLRKEMAEGRFRSDLDPVLGTLSFMGMTLFPFLAFPIAQRVFGLQLDDDFRRRFIAHTSQLFLRGVQTGGEQ